MNQPTYIQERSGEFFANVVPRGQCGFAVGQHRFEYTAKIVVCGLDRHGWVLDNRDLDHLFDGWSAGLWEASCEDLAGGGVCKIIEALGDRAEAVSVTVKPNGFASLTCEWRRGQAHPTFTPKRVKQPQHERQVAA